MAIIKNPGGAIGGSEPKVVNDFQGLKTFMEDVYSDEPSIDITTVDRTFYFENADLNSLCDLFSGLSLSILENLCDLANSHIHMDMNAHGTLYKKRDSYEELPSGGDLPKCIAFSHLEMFIEYDTDTEAGGYTLIPNVNGQWLSYDFDYAIMSGSIRFKYLSIE